MKGRDLIAVLAVAVLVTVPTQVTERPWLRGLSVDLAFWLRHQMTPPVRDVANSPIAVVAIDEETYRQPPFRDLPKVLWTKQIAAVLTQVLDAGAKVVGFDVIFPTSVEPYLPGFDHDFLVALHDGAQDGRVVLGKVQHEVKPVSPYAGYSFAVGNQRNIRALNFFEDPDGVIRRVPRAFRADGPGGTKRVDPSMAVELAGRFLGERVAADSPSRVVIGTRPITAPSDRGILIDFTGGRVSAPTYSLADLSACAEKGDAAFFRKHFAGRLVLIGTVLDVEDRKLTAKRFITAPRPNAKPAARCALPPMKGLQLATSARDSIPGVYLLSESLDDLIRGDPLRETDDTEIGLIVLALSLGAGLAVLALRPWIGGIVVLAGAAAWIVAVGLVLDRGVMLPLLDPLAAMAVAVTVLYGYKFVVADRDKLFLRRAFSLYLPPAEVERIAAGSHRPALGGEERELTVLFVDIEGFTNFSEGRTPAELVGGLNAFLSRATDAVEQHHGFVDKYLGDGFIAVFGAPLHDDDHARHAVEAALQIVAPAEGEPFRTRIGINTGEMLVGNIGSSRRFNYTVMGDAVNLAARLESANKAYGTRLLVSERTRELAGDAAPFREIDRVRVVGRSGPVSVYAPASAEAQHDDGLAYAGALSAYKAGRFDEAARRFEALAKSDPAAAALAARSRIFASDPPAHWDGTTTLESK